MSHRPRAPSCRGSMGRGWMRAVSVVTLLSVTCCSTIRYLPPSALAPRAGASDTSGTHAERPGRWYTLRDFTDSHGEVQHLSGRIRAVAGDSLELDTYASASLTPLYRRSVVPSDSIRVLRVSEFPVGQVFLGIAVVIATIAIVASSIRKQFEHLGSVAAH
jgi:hypothetical protein